MKYFMLIQSYGGSAEAIKDFQERVNNALAEGGELHGSPFSYVSFNSVIVSQAVLFKRK